MSSATTEDEISPRMKVLRKNAKLYLKHLIVTRHHEGNPDMTIEDLVLSDFFQYDRGFVQWLGKEEQYRYLPDSVQKYEQECREAIRWAMVLRGITERQPPKDKHDRIAQLLAELGQLARQ